MMIDIPFEMKYLFLKRYPCLGWDIYLLKISTFGLGGHSVMDGKKIRESCVW